jgi:phage FluMu protein Com
MTQKSLGDAVLEAKCPRCRKGDMFMYPWYKITKFHSANKYCPVCNLRFEIEPGFFFGAMYMSYAFIVAIFSIVGVFLYYVLDDPSIMVYIIGINLAVLILLPLIFRYSRVLYLYLFGGVSYEEE